jgi:hypothetical protein
MNFQTFVGTQPSPAVAGDFASANPRFSVNAGPGGLVAGPEGLTVGLFAWLSYDRVDSNDAPAEANNFGAGPVAGFVHREQQGLITQFLSESSMFIPSGFAVTLMDGGDFWCVNNGTTEAVPGMKAYANFANGEVSFAATGSVNNATGTGAVTAQTFSVTGDIANDTMVVSAVGSGTVVPGATISGTGVATGTQVVSQLLPLEEGEALGGIGRYQLNIGDQEVAAETISGTYGLLTLSAVATGQFGVGDNISGTGVVAGTTITALGTGEGGTGTYIVNNNTAVSSTTITAGTDVETKWFARSTGLPGELVKISSQPMG